MLVVGQHRNVKQRKNIVQHLIAHEGVSVDEGDGFGAARLVSHLRKTFQDRIVPPSLFHVVAARSPIAGARFCPRLDRHNAIVAGRGQRSGCLSRVQCCCEELRPPRFALALCRLLQPRVCEPTQLPAPPSVGNPYCGLVQRAAYGGSCTPMAMKAFFTQFTAKPLGFKRPPICNLPSKMKITWSFASPSTSPSCRKRRTA